MKKSSKNVGHQVRKQVRVQERLVCVQRQTIHRLWSEWGTLLQPNVNGNWRGARLSKGRREKQVIGCCRKWWWGGSQLQRSCWLYITRFFFFFFFPGLNVREIFFLLFSRGEYFEVAKLIMAFLLLIISYLFSDLSWILLFHFNFWYRNRNVVLERLQR